jgi:hypothetical protein
MPSSVPTPPTPPKPEPFPIGSLVRMRGCPRGALGVVVGTHGRRVLVRWSGLNWTGKHLRKHLQITPDPRFTRPTPKKWLNHKVDE